MRKGHPETSFGLVTPYLDQVQTKVVQTFNDAGYPAAAESHLNRKVHVEFADITEAELDRQMDDVVGQIGPGLKVVSTFCTDLRAAQRATHWEDKYAQLIVADTVSTVLWDMLWTLEVDAWPLLCWGSIFITAGFQVDCMVTLTVSRNGWKEGSTSSGIRRERRGAAWTTMRIERWFCRYHWILYNL
ncbi:hypothetical protein EJ03DRAFT_362046 [Teratosphaeria nubilosa]|uniref:Uncharacterized protein n=1 Tax=Teratosphaeria nubilosa TaxID=161662 RepID=A0A6G1LAE6_9PEZI|nr:hypothetical protein EJ03DRAFT_362046 [Teratosphaeria nubilosa]